MSSINSAKFSSSSQVRCVTLVGHVDHGKSSYADSLLASNGIISQRMAGKIRYLDSRLDEQERGITMESSAVSLTFRIRTRDRDTKDKMVGAAVAKSKGKQPAIPSQEEASSSTSSSPSPTPTPSETAFTEQSYLLNLIDTPGHVDFSSEVSTASRLCDGCLLIVDAVEGVCTQTITVLRQAWSDRLTPILVINKIDRLILELKLSPTEAYHHLLNLIERVNAVVGEMWSAERMDEDYRNRDVDSSTSTSKAGGYQEPKENIATENLDHSDSDLYFDPPRGNVIFSSAIDGWAFRVHNFSNLYAAKLGVSEPKFRSVLWGDYFFDAKTKRVLTLKERDREGKGALKNMFTSFVLENIWRVYESIKVERDQEKIDKIISSLNLKIHPRDLKSKDPSILLQAIFAQWLPLSSTTFSTIVTQIPSPLVAQRTRMPSMLHPSLSYFATQVAKPQNEMEVDLYESKEGDEARRIAYVSKMFAVKRSDLPDERQTMELNGNAPRKPLTADEMRERAREAKERREKLKQTLEATGVELGNDNSVQLDEDGKVQEPKSKLETEPSEPSAQAEHAPDSQAPTQSEDAGPAPSPLSSEVLLGFSRLYSGTLRVGDSLSVVLPKYDASLPPSHPHNKKHCKTIKIENLYMIMGRELINVKEVPAGNVCGIRGLEGVVGRNATLCGKPRILEVETKGGGEEAPEEGDWYVNLAGKVNGAAPIVRVAIEPLNPSDMAKLIEGLRLLNQADPCVETLVQETGEHVILTAGELHLERCLKDLRERFANCPLQTSAPLVPFRETAVKAPEMAPPRTEGAPRGTIKSSISNSLVSYTIRAVPLPDSVTRFLLANASTMRTLLSNRGADEKDAGAEAVDNAVAANGVISADGEEDLSSRTVRPEQFWKTLEIILVKAGGEWKDKKLIDNILAFGPRRMGPNLLIDASGEMGIGLRQRAEIRRHHHSGLPTPNTSETSGIDSATLAAANLSLSGDSGASKKYGFSISDLSESIDNGFQMAMQQGPMCAEPVQGMAYYLQKIEVNPEEADKEGARARLSQVTGSLISSVREACRNGLLDWSPRLMLAMYSCDIQASTEVLGKVHGVLAKRRGRIISEEMQEGTAFFTVGSLLPVVESFGFADEIRTRTSGAASPQLIFKGFDLFDLDPFWVPTTQEELEDLGEKGERENVAKKYMDAVRRRKGMFVAERRVEAAEKQRTLKSN